MCNCTRASHPPAPEHPAQATQMVPQPMANRERRGQEREKWRPTAGPLTARVQFRLALSWKLHFPSEQQEFCKLVQSLKKPACQSCRALHPHEPWDCLLPAPHPRQDPSSLAQPPLTCFPGGRGSRQSRPGSCRWSRSRTTRCPQPVPATNTTAACSVRKPWLAASLASPGEVGPPSGDPAHPNNVGTWVLQGASYGCYSSWAPS